MLNWSVILWRNIPMLSLSHWNPSGFYILHAKVLAYVPSAAVKDVLTQPDIDGKRAKWISKLFEFDIEVNPTKLVKCQGLAKIMAEENYDLLRMNFIGISSTNL